MNTTSLHNSNQESHLKVIKNTSKRTKKALNRIYINTLVPGFSYMNSIGETIMPKNCILL